MSYCVLKGTHDSELLGVERPYDSGYCVLKGAHDSELLGVEGSTQQ